MNQLAQELNSQLKGTIVERLFSQMGKRLYFPKGIIAQSGEAKKSAGKANATIGMAYSKGSPLILSAVAESMPSFKTEDIVAYAPTAGVEQLRKDWQNQILKKNPSLKQERISLPVVTQGLTAGLSTVADLFFDEGSVLLASDPCWDNYSLTFEERRSAVMKSVPFLITGAGLDVEAIGRSVREEAKNGQVRIILNFPNNPAGYSPTAAEAEALKKIFLEAANGGADVLVICDDAYFGLFYEDNIYKESIFSLLADLHERILAVKIDGPIKEHYVWGLRVGFVTIGSRGLGAEHYNALVTKIMGAIRSSVSCVNTPAQYMIIKALADERTPREKANFQDLMKRRYLQVKDVIAKNQNHPALTPLPFNSGYFMSFLCKGVSAEALRKELLTRHGIGVISLGNSCLRVAFSSLEEEQIAPVYRTIFDCAAQMARSA